MLKKIILWILVISCMTVIFSFSSQVADESKKTSSSVIEIIVSFFDFDDSLTDEQIISIREELTFIVRKGAHFSIYALLGLLIYLLLCEYNITDKKEACRFTHVASKLNLKPTNIARDKKRNFLYDKKAVIFSVIISMLYACSDEVHQCFVSGRSGEIRDVIIDTAGAFFGCIAVRIIKYLIRRNKNELHGNLQ